MADIPGIIEGAQRRRRAGASVSAARLAFAPADPSAGCQRHDAGATRWTISRSLNRELALYDERWPHLPQIVALNKIDVMQDPAAVDALEAELQAAGT